MTDSTNPGRNRNPAEAIFKEARGAHQTSQQLLPLLSLLEDPEGTGGSLDEIKGLLTEIVEILYGHSQRLDELKSRIGKPPIT